MRFIRSDEDLAWHIGSLTQAHPMFEPLREAAGAVPVRWLDRGFKGLVFVVTGQQISVAAGRAIYGRLEAALGDITAETVAAASDDVLRAAGFSAPKIRTLRALQDAAMARHTSISMRWRRKARRRRSFRCAPSRVSAPGPQRFTCSSPPVTPTFSLRPTWRCKSRSGSPLRSTHARRPGTCGRCPMRGRPGEAPRRASSGPTTA